MGNPPEKEVSDMGKPLEGIKVVELATYVAAPVVGRILCDLGADVVKIEGRGGDAWRMTAANWNKMFKYFNRGELG